MSERRSEYALFDPEAIDAMRPVIRGHKHGIVAGHYLAAEAGFAILEAGGNAIDAGVAGASPSASFIATSSTWPALPRSSFTARRPGRWRPSAASAPGRRR